MGVSRICLPRLFVSDGGEKDLLLILQQRLGGDTSKYYIPGGRR